MWLILKKFFNTEIILNTQDVKYSIKQDRIVNDNDNILKNVLHYIPDIMYAINKYDNNIINPTKCKICMTPSIKDNTYNEINIKSHKDNTVDNIKDIIHKYSPNIRMDNIIDKLYVQYCKLSHTDIERFYEDINGPEKVEDPDGMEKVEDEDGIEKDEDNVVKYIKNIKDAIHIYNPDLNIDEFVNSLYMKYVINTSNTSSYNTSTSKAKKIRKNKKHIIPISPDLSNNTFKDDNMDNNISSMS